ncbi:Ig-like domain repeat protein [Mumia sp. ZJ430]|uniref:Ig-like domain repeat protein n=1 Tax=Mumia sp. ZJ430 TaxID=2708083 RepID=UPI001422D803|nr:Ig-like domain repeat protein [Mumia sp. ZJ430]
MRTLVRQGATVAVASAVALVGLGAPATAAPGVPVNPANAGKAVVWGAESLENSLPPSLDGKRVTAIDAAASYSVALTADGSVVAWGDPDKAMVHGVPAGLANLKAVSAGQQNVVAIKSDGTAVAWGDATGIEVIPGDLGRVSAVDVGLSAFALKTDGTVRVWGGPTAALLAPPAGLSNVVNIAAGNLFALALKADGTVVAWGLTPPTIPDEVQGEVTGIGAGQGTAALITSDGKVTVLGERAADVQPAGLASEVVTDVDVETTIVARTASGKAFSWGGNPVNPDLSLLNTLPASLDGAPVSTIVAGTRHNLALVATFGAISKPTIAGTARSGQTLTAADAEFSMEPENVTTQWQANGQPITGATSSTLKLTDAHIGKSISVSQTATKGSESATATSASTAAVASAQVNSTLRATAPAVRYGAAPRVTVAVAPTNAAGRVDVYKGATRLGSANAVKGRAVVVLSRTALKPGTHTLSVRYAGNASTKPSSTSARLVVAKASAKVGASVATKKIVAKKTKAKVRVTVRATGVTPTGKVAVYLGKRKLGTATLRGGKATIKLKALPKAGKAKLSIRYLGSSTVNKATKTIKVKVRKR